MSLCKGLLLGKENDGFYIRMENDAITDIQFINKENVFYSKNNAEKALFKATLAGKKRKPNKNIWEHNEHLYHRS